MQPTSIRTFLRCPRYYYGEALLRAADALRQAAAFAVICLVLTLAAGAARAQQATPGFDPRQTEKHFDDLQSRQGRATRAPLQVPSLARPDVSGDRRPLFILRTVSVIGAAALPREKLAAVYQPYLGKEVS